MTAVGLYTVFLLLLISAAGARTPRSKQLLLLAGSYLFYGIWGLEFPGHPDRKFTCQFWHWYLASTPADS